MDLIDLAAATWTRWLPLLVLLGGILGSTGLIVVRPGPAPGKAPPPAPAVRVEAVWPGEVQVRVQAQGTLEPRVENDLVAEVGGRIEWVAPALETGARFAAEEVLVRIEDADLRIAHEKAAAAVDRARHRLELANASHARRRSLEQAGAASSAALDEAASTAGVAAADLREAQATLEAAQRDLERSVLRAPFEGRARELRTDVGEIVASGTAVARLFAVDVAEVRLSIPDSELAFLEIPAGSPADGQPASAGSEVLLRGRFAGAVRELRGTVVGTEGALDPRTRMITVLVRVPSPEGRPAGPPNLEGRPAGPPSQEAGPAGLPALPMGLFVDATLFGRPFDSIVTLPRRALRGRDTVAVVDDQDRLYERQVSVLRTDGERVLVDGGLAPGERVCTSPLDLAVDGMRVRVIDSDRSQAPQGRSREYGAAR